MRNRQNTAKPIHPTESSPYHTTPFAIPQQPAKAWAKDFAVTGGILAAVIVVPQLLSGLLF